MAYVQVTIGLWREAGDDALGIFPRCQVGLDHLADEVGGCLYAVLVGHEWVYLGNFGCDRDAYSNWRQYAGFSLRQLFQRQGQQPRSGICKGLDNAEVIGPGNRREYRVCAMSAPDRS